MRDRDLNTCSRIGPSNATWNRRCRPPAGKRAVSRGAKRPAVLSRDAAVRGLRRTLAAPCTTTVRGPPSEVALQPDTDPVPRACVAGLDAIESVSVALLVERIGRLGDQRMREICALAISVDCRP
ncbi:MAG: type II toxin-antitoxin system PemK/MazF family toxin [Terracoccus sp.]